MTSATASPAMESAIHPAVAPIVNPESAAVDGEYQQLMSDLFHELSQPLSTLTCLLEVNLLLSRSLTQIRHDFKIALQQIRSIVRLVRSLRELSEAGNAQQDQQVFSLAGCLREALADLLPVAKSAKIKLSLISSADCPVNFQASRLRHAVFHLLELALSSSAAGAEVRITAGEEDDGALVKIAISAVDDSASMAVAGRSIAESVEEKERVMKRRLGLAIARRILISGRGSLQSESEGERLRLEVRLPLASVSK